MTLIGLVWIACVGGWLFGEVNNRQLVRVFCVIGIVTTSSIIAASASGLLTAVSIGFPLTSAVHEYLDASKGQLRAGNVEFVIQEFDDFKERAFSTYETGAFREAVDEETKRMVAGPPDE